MCWMTACSGGTRKGGYQMALVKLYGDVYVNPDHVAIFKRTNRFENNVCHSDVEVISTTGIVLLRETLRADLSIQGQGAQVNAAIGTMLAALGYQPVDE